ncbi:hypothetical protein M422DRAFT_260726 [Sphaerobolus stellatus SS14]|uniref:Uncharacterized protein n=1 Tax=Sphaerobolus stellatus (strain SS14) TaxID=990650 RepID=A0A0C9UQ94_SPHS4|nr:hypothetical protein M422DRAFT_260726 [Sphaerobolus stellatus SS14]
MSVGERSTAWIDVSADAGVTYIWTPATPATTSFEDKISGGVERTTAVIYPKRHRRVSKMAQIAPLHRQRNLDVSTPIIDSALNTQVSIHGMLPTALSDLRIIRPINVIPTSFAQFRIST